ncbi:uncharacterized protein Bfra_002150 [Botrytis fragariae]|uniref:Uncharacterized protein n=1 Tax=Botrytis fragariae TaxID=1964551 RepID=A0A8H6B250_9HELO|nr:uncharacterized protein Bfra_002150 [Botrytis fragariae]KAF5877783.1 hypothetical protein Bfra_002150 [Botrytis fragariae]
MAILRFLQDPIGLAPEFVTSTIVASHEHVQNTLTTSISSSTRRSSIALPAITTTKTSTLAPIQTLITSLLYREPSNIQLAVADPTPTHVQSEPSTNVHSNFPQFGRLAVTPYQLMYIIAVCVCFMILMSFCCCTDDIGRYIKSNRRTNPGATMQAAPVWPGALRFVDGADDRSRSNRTSRSHSAISDSTARPLMPQAAERVDSPATSTIPMNTFTKITIKKCEEGHESIILDEIELRDLASAPSCYNFSNGDSGFTHEYLTNNPEADAHSRRKVSLRGGSGAEDNLLRTGAITSFKQTEERWKPTWSATKSLFSSRRRGSEPIPAQNTSRFVSNSSTTLGNNHSSSSQSGDRFLQKSSTTISKRASRQENTSGTIFSFPMSEGSDSEIPRFPTLNRIKRKLRPLIHSVSKQSLREKFSLGDHSGEHSTEEANSEEIPYSSTVRKALRRARSSASIPFGLFKLPEPARNDPEPSVAGPVSIISSPNDIRSVDSDTASENTLRARSPVSTLLGVRTDRISDSGHRSRSLQKMVKSSAADGADVASSLAFSNARKIEGRCGSGYEIRGPNKVVVAMGHLESVASEIDSGAVLTCSNSGKERERPGSFKETSADGEEKKDDDETEDENGGQVFNPEIAEKLGSIYVACRSVHSSQGEDNDEAVEIEPESSDEPYSCPNSTSVGNANKVRKRGQTAMANHFHARARRVGTDSTDSSGSLVSGNRRKLKGRLGLLMIRGVTGGEDRGVGARRGGKVELVSMNFGGIIRKMKVEFMPTSAGGEKERRGGVRMRKFGILISDGLFSMDIARGFKGSGNARA